MSFLVYGQNGFTEVPGVNVRWRGSSKNHKAKKHNNANVLCIGGRFITPKRLIKIYNAFAQAKFEGNRHLKRVEKIDKKEF
jgi:RpiB/LacA/LacB family sugar-phosphate isomerase